MNDLSLWLTLRKVQSMYNSPGRVYTHVLHNKRSQKIFFVEKGYRSRHFLYFEHDGKEEYCSPEIPYVEEYVEEPF